MTDLHVIKGPSSVHAITTTDIAKAVYHLKVKSKKTPFDNRIGQQTAS